MFVVVVSVVRLTVRQDPRRGVDNENDTENGRPHGRNPLTSHFTPDTGQRSLRGRADSVIHDTAEAPAHLWL